jgi:hypothetical protein
LEGQLKLQSRCNFKINFPVTNEMSPRPVNAVEKRLQQNLNIMVTPVLAQNAQPHRHTTGKGTPGDCLVHRIHDQRPAIQGHNLPGEPRKRNQNLSPTSEIEERMTGNIHNWRKYLFISMYSD